jgi:hypothetical protein
MPLAEINWTELFKGSSGENLGPVIFVVCIFLIVIVSIVASHWRKARLLRLKEQMIERGFTAHEITAVIGAGEEQGRASKAAAPIGGPPTNVPDCRKVAAN